MKILVLGCNGQLGRCLNDQLGKTDHNVIYTSRHQIDVADFESTKSQIKQISPNVVINATAYTAVDKAEEDQKTADLINHLAVANIAAACHESSCWLVHISTDYVFDGRSNVPYKEDDQENPQGVYGKTKLRGEKAIQFSGCRHIIIRTAWVFSEYGNNFFKTMLKLGTNRNELSVVGDQYGCPTYAQDLARYIVMVLTGIVNGDAVVGLFHYCGNRVCSWYEFAQAIFAEAKKVGLKTPVVVTSIDSKDYPTVAVRPSFSALDCSKTRQKFKTSPSNWRNGIVRALANVTN